MLLFKFMSNKICSICLNNICEKKLIQTKCNHCFHNHCIKKWLKLRNTCPLCRKILLNKTKVSVFLDNTEFYNDINLYVEEHSLIFKLNKTKTYNITYYNLKRIEILDTIMFIEHIYKNKFIKTEVHSENIFQVYELIKNTIENQLLST